MWKIFLNKFITLSCNKKCLTSLQPPTPLLFGIKQISGTMASENFVLASEIRLVLLATGELKVGLELCIMRHVQLVLINN